MGVPKGGRRQSRNTVAVVSSDSDEQKPPQKAKPVHVQPRVRNRRLSVLVLRYCNGGPPGCSSPPPPPPHVCGGSLPQKAHTGTPGSTNRHTHSDFMWSSDHIHTKQVQTVLWCGPPPTPSSTGAVWRGSSGLWRPCLIQSDDGRVIGRGPRPRPLERSGGAAGLRPLCTAGAGRSWGI